jgi:hypothetical protein
LATKAAKADLDKTNKAVSDLTAALQSIEQFYPT